MRENEYHDAKDKRNYCPDQTQAALQSEHELLPPVSEFRYCAGQAEDYYLKSSKVNNQDSRLRLKSVIHRAKTRKPLLYRVHR